MNQQVRRWVLAGVAAILATAGLITAYSPSSTAPPANTAAVERASVSMGVSSTGSLAALTEQNLGFAKGGQLTSVAVKVGDHVTAGQVLATIDPLPARQALATAKAQLNSQEASLDKVTDSPIVHDAKESLSQAKDVLDAVRRQVDAQDSADASAIVNAQQQYAMDAQAASKAKSSMDAACAGGPSPSCTSAQSAYSAAQQKAASSQSALRAAEQKRSVDQAAGRVSIETAQQAVVTARNAVDTSRSDRPHNIDQQEALVASAKAAVVQAQRDLDNTTLRAPVAGTVTALNGTVGEWVAPSTGTSALAPGTDAAIPGTGGSTGGGSSTTSGSQINPARPGGTQFLVLSDIDEYQVVGVFNESDAAELRANQHVDVTFDAITDLTMRGTILSVAPASTSVAGVIGYYVTVALDDSDDRLKVGLTANVNVVTSEQSDVLTVPNAAVRKVKGRSAVTVVDGDQRRTVFFEPGMVGLDRTEIISGLREGQRVALPATSQGGAR